MSWLDFDMEANSNIIYDIHQDQVQLDSLLRMVRVLDTTLAMILMVSNSISLM